ncbi:MAG: hypothetical protein FJZ80_05260 [Bacteroidetes bacterium]|nr:hypothetical protein [Bacteroidota bacterium]
MTSSNSVILGYGDSLPQEKRKSAAISAGLIASLCLLLFLIKYTTPDPPPVAHLMVEDEILDAISVEDLLIADGGSAKGGGTPANDERSEPMQQSERLLTAKGQEPIENGKSNHSVGSNPDNPSSAPYKANNPFGDGGNGGGRGGGNGPFDGNGRGTGDDGNAEGDGLGNGKERIRNNDPVLPKYNTDVDLKIHLKLTVSGDGNVTNAVFIKSKSTTTDQTIISDVIRQVIRQVKYNKDPNGKVAYCWLTIKVNAQ